MVCVVEGLVALNKPSGISSAALIDQLKALIRKSEIARLFQAPAKKHKRNMQLLKIGHGGTLDPLASGVLVIGFGNATKQLSRFLNCSKTYRAEVILGSATDTYDAEGGMIAKRSTSFITKELVEEAIKQFNKPSCRQVPPLYSAIKMDGLSLYEYARRGLALPRNIPERNVSCCANIVGFNRDHNYNETQQVASKTALESEKLIRETSKIPLFIYGDKGQLKQQEDWPIGQSIEELYFENPAKKIRLEAVENIDRPLLEQEIGSFDEEKRPLVQVELRVSSGFYVRSLAHDLGRSLNSAAHIISLQRIEQGEFSLEKGNVLDWENFQSDSNTWQDLLLSNLTVHKQYDQIDTQQNTK